MTEIYRTTVSGAGPEATAFIGQGMFVTFGEDAPEALREFCFIIDAAAQTSQDIEVGQELVLDGRAYPITAVGDVARKNLDQLGHVTVNVDGAATAKMHGAIHVSGEIMPELAAGSTIAILVP
ncbi:PTS glucitol/sorbitol transporter subunit IIA [Raineyella fluvialis]|uniref:PTS sorbitol transporter subunit IIA n=1 Tax=Raineyella fluvialis TaxID=2662261 RepID=A0A5Q2FBZ0_9ACTN|nr:PTS glucitol/sorbitol transporter subunit IIA [Raineyella fluvialis]QGF23237.1 PTS sorbitol transporter subunit IIA [Raineyella fluvialis]